MGGGCCKWQPSREEELSQLGKQMVRAAETKSSRWQLCSSEIQDYAQNPLLQPPGRESFISSPCVLEIGDHVHLWASTARGILHFAAKDGLCGWVLVELTVDLPGATRPSVRSEESVVYLFYETEGRVCQMSARPPCQVFALEEWLWSEAQEILEPELEWEKVCVARVGSPYVAYDCQGDRWLLFYSASATLLDSILHPLFSSVAAAESIDGPYRRLQEKPLFGTAAGSPQVIGAGCFKLIHGFDNMEFQEDAPATRPSTPHSPTTPSAKAQRRLLALQCRVTRSKGVTSSSLALLASSDAHSWTVVEPDFLLPTRTTGWKKAYIFAFDTLAPSFDPDYVYIYYSARSGYSKGKETIGVSKVSRDFLELSAGGPTVCRAA
ncbi:unnamed protein product [Effrenium voratum]|nr:unnamed protein product [Effrenium voratum]